MPRQPLAPPARPQEKTREDRSPIPSAPSDGASRLEATPAAIQQLILQELQQQTVLLHGLVQRIDRMTGDFSQVQEALESSPILSAMFGGKKK